MVSSTSGDSRHAVDDMLRAAAAAGVRLPSESLDRFGLCLPEFDWRALSEFQARHPVEITHDEDGEPLPTAVLALQHHPVEEADDDELMLSA